ncbi:putative ADP,ATP carrier protein [Acorus calamus]|uniref:ADP/ATP translocase n=1 Tax=Acorus calamus TaxID=4465 RepID=A0AAV9EPB3_ACOCL|nr:putative ADP,ATP carrier protein [Acorus calamus]
MIDEAEHEEEEAEEGEKWKKKKTTTLWEFQRDLVAGAVMGGAVHTVVAPIERAKLLLQTQESNWAMVIGRRRRFKGLVDCILRMIREDGVLSLWRGNGTGVLRYYPSVALNFSLKDLYRTMLRSATSKGDTATLGAPANFMAGAAAGCTTLIIIYPLDIAHTRLAADIGKSDSRQFKGIITSFRQST